MATTLNVSGLSNYVETHKDELLAKASLDAKTLRYVDIMPNVKYQDAIPMLDSEITFQDGSVCGFNPTGSDTVSEKTITTYAAKVEKSWCWKDFEKKYMNYQLKWEAGRENRDFCEKMADHNLGLVQEGVEEMVWQGNSGISVDGFIKQISENESASTIAVSGITSASTIADKIDAVVAALPAAALKKGAYVFLSYTNLRKYILAQNAICCASRPIQDAAVEELPYLGDSRVTLVPVNGIGDDAIVGASKDALVYATDIENSHNVYRLWENEETEKINFRVLFRIGTALRWPDEVVYWKTE